LPFELAGKFRLDRLLGSGGMGVVYRAVDLELGRSVALKTLPRLKGGALGRLRREARSMATFVHPNLALLFGLESWQEVPVLVVEYLEGGSLASRLPPGLPERLALQVVADIAGALDAMHRQGHLHRDVKPQNIAFAADGTPKLLDFGLAHLASEGLAAIEAERDAVELTAEERLTRSGTVVGTPLYLSPEVSMGDPPSPAQDLWSLHLVLWESLTGEHPLAQCAPHKMLQRLLSADLPFERLGAAGVSRGVVQLLAAGLSPEPAARLGTAAEVRRALLGELERP
jgi:serine/threonine protein kinase